MLNYFQLLRGSLTFSGDISSLSIRPLSCNSPCSHWINFNRMLDASHPSSRTRSSGVRVYPASPCCMMAVDSVNTLTISPWSPLSNFSMSLSYGVCLHWSLHLWLFRETLPDITILLGFFPFPVTSTSHQYLLGALIYEGLGHNSHLRICSWETHSNDP